MMPGMHDTDGADDGWVDVAGLGPMPPPPTVGFASDNTAGAHPAVLDALVAANSGGAPAYGEDRWTAALRDAFADRLGGPVELLTCWGGTGANVVGLASVLAPWQAVVCADSSHLVVDECGAPGRFTGSPLLTVVAEDGKLTADALDGFVPWLDSHHHPQPAVLSVSQTTELGTCYSLDELAALGDAAHRHGMVLHLDGARLANAVAALGADLRSMIADTGVDVFTFGATKNGAVYGESVVWVRPELAATARYHHKQAGQLASKARFIAAQQLALLDGDRWLANAAHANAMAGRLAAAVAEMPGIELVATPDANAVFARLPVAAIEPLQAWSFFWEWDLPSGLVRWMTSWATTVDDVDRFAAGLRHALRR
jgi:threonine aldolase